MIYRRVVSMTAFPIMAVFVTAAAAQDPSQVQEMKVWGERGNPEFVKRVDLDNMPLSAPDTGDLLKTIPGANIVSNGPLAGQAQYRGMFGPRLNIQLDGMYVNSGGPNWMDPPLHYMPEPILDRFEVIEGIAPVSMGTSIGGAIDAKAKSSEFTDSDAVELQANVLASGRTVSDSYAFGGLVGIANERFRLHVIGSKEEGDDIEFNGGKITPGTFDRYVYGAGGGVRIGGQEFGFSYRHHETTDAGNPSLPMDTRLVDTELLNGEYKGEWNGVGLEAQVYYSDIDHAMDNFTLRPAPMSPMMFRFIEAQAEGLGFEVKGTLDALGGQLVVGADGHWGEHTMTITNPNAAAFFVLNLNEAKKDRIGGFIELRRDLASGLHGDIGVRFTHVTMDAGDVAVGPALPPPAVALAAAFNAADRSKTDNNVDIVGHLKYDASTEVTLHLSAARKTRSPNYLERYSWLPIETSLGLADGNNYVGDIDLEPEVSYEVEAGFDWQRDWFFIKPRFFMRHVNNYIQGAPVDATPGVIDSPLEMVSGVNGDPSPLRYTNVDARLIGVDAAWGVELPNNFRLDGIVTYVRGKRRDISDTLYRITPLRATAALSYVRNRWSFTVEGVGVAKQNRVSVTNNETTTPGHTLLNINGMVQVTDKVKFVAGIDNVLDNFYQEHLSGFNRIAGSDVPLGARLPGAGRNFFARLTFVM